ncbi:hypothetical protein A5685_07085 [Mycobacterium colombiense]|uniref:Uncharacterized protein n=1 Tax=Mycobacterium colombiense TaxID=339268 RepID=A0A1A2RZC0_9MYCO|nr:hypothetical protein [Mycobacterium colombiense]OBH57224.1 hypothetical protein A5685_07085 [Mycobacterium colombiense]
MTTLPSGYRSGATAAAFAFRSLTIDVGLLPLCARSHAPAELVFPLQSLAFALRGRPLAFVRALLAFVCHPLAVVRYPLTLVGDPISSPRLEFASLDVSLTLGEGLFALVERMSPPFQLCGRLDTILGGHSSP